MTALRELQRITQEAWRRHGPLVQIAEAADGSCAAFCTGWLDDENAVGELEPVGTHPVHGRRGLARAVCLAVLHALRDAGASRAVVCARGDDAYPAARALYESLGFERAAIHRPYLRAR